MHHPVIFRTFEQESQALRFAEKLIKWGVPSRVALNSAAFDLTFAGNLPPDQYQVIVDGLDRARAREMELEEARAEVAHVGPEYYLCAFTNEELRAVLAEGEPWSAFDWVLAQTVLAERGAPATADEIERFRSAQIAMHNAPESAERSLLVAGYAFSVLGPVMGLAIGLSLMFSRKTLATGERVFRYGPADRAHGMRIVALGLATVVICLFVSLGLAA